MRPSPKSIFFGIVAVGLPVVVTAGWLLGASEPASTSPGPGSATGFGTAPGTGMGSAGEKFSPALRRPVAAQSRVSGDKLPGGRPVRPSATGRDLPDPTLIGRPVPSPTKAAQLPTQAPTQLPPTGDPFPPS